MSLTLLRFRSSDCNLSMMTTKVLTLSLSLPFEIALLVIPSEYV